MKNTLNQISAFLAAEGFKPQSSLQTNAAAVSCSEKKKDSLEPPCILCYARACLHVMWLATRVCISSLQFRGRELASLEEGLDLNRSGLVSNPGLIRQSLGEQVQVTAIHLRAPIDRNNMNDNAGDDCVVLSRLSYKFR